MGLFYLGNVWMTELRTDLLYKNSISDEEKQESGLPFDRCTNGNKPFIRDVFTDWWQTLEEIFDQHAFDIDVYERTFFTFSSDNEHISHHSHKRLFPQSDVSPTPRKKVLTDSQVKLLFAYRNFFLLSKAFDFLETFAITAEEYKTASESASHFALTPAELSDELKLTEIKNNNVEAQFDSVIFALYDLKKQLDNKSVATRTIDETRQLYETLTAIVFELISHYQQDKHSLTTFKNLFADFYEEQATFNIVKHFVPQKNKTNILINAQRNHPAWTTLKDFLFAFFDDWTNKLNAVKKQTKHLPTNIDHATRVIDKLFTKLTGYEQALLDAKKALDDAYSDATLPTLTTASTPNSFSYQIVAGMKDIYQRFDVWADAHPYLWGIYKYFLMPAVIASAFLMSGITTLSTVIEVASAKIGTWIAAKWTVNITTAKIGSNIALQMASTMAATSVGMNAVAKGVQWINKNDTTKTILETVSTETTQNPPSAEEEITTQIISAIPASTSTLTMTVASTFAAGLEPANTACIDTDTKTLPTPATSTATRLKSHGLFLGRTNAGTASSAEKTSGKRNSFDGLPKRTPTTPTPSP